MLFVRRLLLLALVLPIVMLACTPAAPPPGGTDCTAACQRLQDLGCTTMTPANVDCATWLCGSYGAQSTCIARAASCEDADQKQIHGC